ncbi:MAG: glycoside hydrolase family 52 protein [Candidatus Sumerlaeia bacterium]
MTTRSHSFQMEHSPRGAEASFTLGHVGMGGGFSLEQGKLLEQDVYIGYFQDGEVVSLPYNKQGGASVDTGMAEFIPTGDPESEKYPPVNCRFLAEADIRRDFALATDTWQTDKIEFSLVTPVRGIPDPDHVPAGAFKDSICPAITGRIVFDNRNSDTPMRGFFAVGGVKGFRQLDEITGGELSGIMAVEHYGFAVPNAENVTGFSDMFMDFPFRRPEPIRNFLSGIGGILVDVEPGDCVALPMVFGWYKPGIVTLGKACQYMYTHYFADLLDVLRYGLMREEAWRNVAEKEDDCLRNSGMNEARQFLYAKSIRSYWGSTQLFAEGKRPRWVVNEGSCNMINTLDLTVDMAFWETREHPWLLRNVLDASADEYSYVDTLHFPGDETPQPGGVSFTHDHGFRNTFSRTGYSHYEAKNHPECFSYMTHEELLNWILCAAVYAHGTQDREWVHRRIGLIGDCLDSMLNRDHPDADQRNGVMGLDSNRCGMQSEITTYDSLDPSLGQARNNTYMAIKCWAAYVALDYLFQMAGADAWQSRIETARNSARLAATTVTNAFDEKLGYIPAILEGDDQSAIIPVIEALVYPEQLGLSELLTEDGPYGELIQALKKHHQAVLVEGRCLFPDGGWKLSGNNDNSWMSKIFICQYVAEKILGLKPDEKSDEAHDHWWRVGCARQSVVDQVVGGKTGGSGAKYPRTASCVLWNDL